MKYINKLGSIKRLLYFNIIAIKILLKNYFFSGKDFKYLFVLSPPFCGSTLLTQIISSSNNVSCNNNIGLMEGQHLPQAKDILFTKDRWDIDKKIDWIKVKSIWHKYWDLSKPILLEKSPPNIIRVEKINKYFNKVKFICLVRNPYAQIQSNLRRYNTDIKVATTDYIKYLKFQKENLNKYDSILIKYEDLTEQPLIEKEKIIQYLPVLHDIKIDLKFSAHNIRKSKNLPLTNLNKESIDMLSKEQISSINIILKKEEKILSFFDYSSI
jgi:hypothetical protein